MRRWADSWRVYAFAFVLFAVLAPITVDEYNSLNDRAFLDLTLKGNPFRLGADAEIRFRDKVWSLDWPYPPLTMALAAPAWALYRLTGSESLYQLLFKLPLFASAVVTQWVIGNLIAPGWKKNQLILGRWFVLIPGVLMLDTVMGGFDMVAAMLLLLAYVLFLCKRSSMSGLALGLAVGLRLYPLVLVPVYLIQLWRTASRRLWEACAFAAWSLAPLFLSCLPFALADAGAFFGMLARRQAVYGPFATLNFAAPVVRRILAAAGVSVDFQGLGLFLFGATIAAMLALYIWMAMRAKPLLLRNSLLVLVVFFLLYPKVHGLYTLSFLPLAIVGMASAACWVWVPGTAWMLLVNGDFGASGLVYWLAPLLGTWNRELPASLDPPLTIFLTAAQAALLAWAAAELFWPRRSTIGARAMEPAQ